jgi:3'-phosphoadenosine 5'-phosphosulfate sulfotransferase (PAPS reductase)/FAD synthetase
MAVCEAAPMSRLVTLAPVRTDRGVVTDSTVDAALAAGAAVAVGVSGGKDSCGAALATVEHLNAIGHTGPRLLIHSDLGRVEWTQSIAVCESLAERLGVELAVVRRAAGDMMDRWLTRWDNNVERYADLSCVKLILPWSTPAMRFCTSELKVAVICRELVKRYPGRTIVNACGIRRAESSGRKNAPISKEQKKLTSRPRATVGIDWHPIVEWSTPDVYAFLRERRCDLHEAYTRYGVSRVSCRFCIMQSEDDKRASASCPDNHAILREMVGLEIASTFAFQGDHWLGDIAPHVLGEEVMAELGRAKQRAKRREIAERRIPDHLLYEKGWPNVMPTIAEAEMLAEVRAEVSDAVGIEIRCTSASEILARYEELMRLKESKR